MKSESEVENPNDKNKRVLVPALKLFFRQPRKSAKDRDVPSFQDCLSDPDSGLFFVFLYAALHAAKLRACWATDHVRELDIDKEVGT